MKNLLALLFILLCTTAGLQAQSSTPTYRTGDGFQLRDLVMVLDLSNDQLATLKNYFTVTTDAMRQELEGVEDMGEKMTIRKRYQDLRDEKVRSILNDDQQPLFDTYVENRESGQRELEEVPVEGGGK